MVQEGAYSKAVKTAGGEPATLTSAEQARWAGVLLPPTVRADALYVPSGDADVEMAAPATGRAPPTNSTASQRGEDHPLKGVRYAALTSPGPTGTRPEHAQELLHCRTRRVANRLGRAMLGTQNKIAAGNLIPEATWIKRTRLIFLQKPGSDTPRPVRMGEFLRGCMAKRMQRQAAPRLRRTCRSYHQWGVEMPGGAEALVHWRSTIEELAISGAIEPLIAFDLDLQNMFGSIEWAELRRAVDRDLQEASAWFQWQHSTFDEIDLPGGGTAFSNRGSGQGDVFGSSTSSLTLGGHMSEHRASFGATQPSQPCGAVDEWFIDDGQAFVKPAVADTWLRSVDRAIAAFGGQRARGAQCKSVARLLCAPGSETALDGWATDYIRASCKVSSAAEAPKVLGVRVGGQTATTADFQTITSKVERVRQAVQELGSAPCEVTLHRRCLGVSKAQYALRCNGDRIDCSALEAFDADTRHGVEETLGGAMPDASWVQASLGVDAGGLGLRDASLVALPAFIASRVAARPLVAEMASHVEEAGLCSAAQCMAAYDQRTHLAAQRWSQVLPDAVRGEATQLTEEAAAAAARRWQAWCEGEVEQPEAPDDAADAQERRGSRRPGAGMVPEAGTEDPEHPAAPHGAGALRLQRQLTRLMDACVARGLLASVRQSGDWEREHLLAELAAPHVNHEWLWRIDPNKGPALQPDEYTNAVRLRLAAAGPSEMMTCGCCGDALLGPSGFHALLCARGPSTRGHNAVRDTLFKVACSLDPSSEHEPTGLIASRPLLRPADLLTGASGFSARLAALDVGICCPGAGGAGSDCVESMKQRKLGRMQPFSIELEQAGVEYRPITFSCFGRPHPDAKALLQSFGRKLARRHGTEAHVEERRLAAYIGVEIWRRAALMVRQCLPNSAEEEAEDGHSPLPAAILQRVGPPGTVAPLPFDS